jgi:quercetin dioxygenase-like cupin family protein
MTTITDSATPAPASTYEGAPLPIVGMPQKELLTVNENDLPMLEDFLGPGISGRIFRLDLERNEYVALATFAPGTSIPLHYHTGPAEIYTLKGCWIYKEYPDQPQTAGSYLYEPGGSVHTLYTPAENTEDTVMLARVSGTNVNFDENGAFHSLLDAVHMRYMVDALTAERGLEPVRYIQGGDTGFTADA